MTNQGFSILALTATLAACGSSSAPPPTSEDIVAAHISHLANAMDSGPLTENMPQTGNVAYTGSFGLQVADDPGKIAVGDAKINVAFGSNLMSGGVDQMYYANIDDEGGLTYVQDDPFGTAITFEGAFNGAEGYLYADGLIDGKTIDGDISTAFTGANAENLVGLGTGDIEGTGVHIFLNTQK